MRRRAWLTSALVLAMIGCGEKGPPMGPVRGKVTLDNQPLSEGVVVFESIPGGFGSSAVLQPDGSYSIRCQYGNGLPVGRYRVAITPPRRGPAEIAKQEDRTPSQIPVQYMDLNTSRLEIDVQSAAGPFDFSLQR